MIRSPHNSSPSQVGQLPLTGTWKIVLLLMNGRDKPVHWCQKQSAPPDRWCVIRLHTCIVSIIAILLNLYSIPWKNQSLSGVGCYPLTLGKGRQVSGLELHSENTDCTVTPLPQLPRWALPLQIPLIWFLTCQKWVWHSSQAQGRLACARGAPRRRGTLSGSRATAIGLSEATFW